MKWVFVRGLSRVIGVAALTSLAGCGGSQTQDLYPWIQEQRNASKPGVPTVSEPKKFMPVSYPSNSAADPFNSQKLVQAIKGDVSQTSAHAALLASEEKRRKEALEAYPLDAIAMVGTLQQQGESVALVRADQLLYQVRKGNYIGQNYGKVVQVTDTELVLREIVQDGTGEWIERRGNLKIQEASK
jgi:type IV pilus assembly protein PilP